MKLLIGKEEEPTEEPLRLWLEKQGENVFLCASRGGAGGTILVIGADGTTWLPGRVSNRLGLSLGASGKIAAA